MHLKRSKIIEFARIQYFIEEIIILFFKTTIFVTCQNIQVSIY